MLPAGSRGPGHCQLHLLHSRMITYLKLNLGLGNVCLTAASAGNLLGLSNLVPDSLSEHQYRPFTCRYCSYFGAEILQWVSLDRIDAKDRSRLHRSESARQKELLAAALFLDDLNQAGLQLFDRRNVIRQDTHIAGFRREVDLDAVQWPWSVTACSGCGIDRTSGRRTHLATCR